MPSLSVAVDSRSACTRLRWQRGGSGAEQQHMSLVEQPLVAASTRHHSPPPPSDPYALTECSSRLTLRLHALALATRRERSGAAAYESSRTAPRGCLHSTPLSPPPFRSLCPH